MMQVGHADWSLVEREDVRALIAQAAWNVAQRRPALDIDDLISAGYELTATRHDELADRLEKGNRLFKRRLTHLLLDWSRTEQRRADRHVSFESLTDGVDYGDTDTGEIDLGGVPYWPTPPQAEIDARFNTLAGELLEVDLVRP